MLRGRTRRIHSRMPRFLPPKSSSISFSSPSRTPISTCPPSPAIIHTSPNRFSDSPTSNPAGISSLEPFPDRRHSSVRPAVLASPTGSGASACVVACVRERSERSWAVFANARSDWLLSDQSEFWIRCALLSRSLREVPRVGGRRERELRAGELRSTASESAESGREGER